MGLLIGIFVFLIIGLISLCVDNTSGNSTMSTTTESPAVQKWNAQVRYYKNTFNYLPTNLLRDTQSTITKTGSILMSGGIPSSQLPD